MKKSFLATGLAVILSLPFASQAADYVIDTKGAHASINFKISHLGYSFIKGRFNRFSGHFSFDKQNIESSVVKVTIDTMSIDSNHAERDKHIRSKDLINATKYTQATFTSTKIMDRGDGKLNVFGNLTLHGVTKPITIAAEFIGAGKDPWGNNRAGFAGTTRLELADFNIPIMGTSSYVEMELHIEGIQK